jgi:hypothetical protein
LLGASPTGRHGIGKGLVGQSGGGFTCARDWSFFALDVLDQVARLVEPDPQYGPVGTGDH